jgi:hypothetical protein
MSPAWRDTFLQHAETDEYLCAISGVESAIVAIHDEYGSPCVAWSGGKDCMVMLHIASLVRGQHTAVWSDFGRPEYRKSKVFPAWLAREIESAALACGASALHVSCRRCDWPDALNAHTGRVAGVMTHVDDTTDHWVLAQQRLMQTLGHDVALVGLRKDEGIGRRHRIDAGRALGEFPERWPVADLSEMDIWAYITAHDLPYCSVYDRNAELAGTYLGLRVTSLFRDHSARCSEMSADSVLFWRDRPRG